MEKSEKAATGIPSLKIKYNKVFGYFIEVTNPHLQLVPERYIRKQTLVNAERFLTAELKELEDKILKAEEKIVGIEKRLYLEVLAEIQRFSAAAEPQRRPDRPAGRRWPAAASSPSAGATCARRSTTARPSASRTAATRCVEAASGRGFIPNDLSMSAESEQILIITGPNMGGKSTYLRQNALIVILAQAGCFVPAARAQIGICDRIFTRIGASDSLIEGKSTFLVEMIETAIILNNAGARSLILLDEIGRGTSTYDGLSIAWAVVEFLHALKAEAARAVRHPLPRADRAGRHPRAGAQLPHRRQGVAGQRHLPAQDHARPDRPELRHPRGQDRRHPAQPSSSGPRRSCSTWRKRS